MVPPSRRPPSTSNASMNPIFLRSASGQCPGRTVTAGELPEYGGLVAAEESVAVLASVALPVSPRKRPPIRARK